MWRYGFGCTLVVVIPMSVAFGQMPAPEARGPIEVGSGVFFLAGDRLDPPYVFTFDGDTLRINDRPLKPLRPTQSPGIVVSENAKRRHDLMSEWLAYSEALLRRGRSRSAVRDSLLRVLRAHPLVEEAGVHGEGAAYLRWADGRAWKEIIRVPLEKTSPPRAWCEVCWSDARRYADYLDRDNLVVVGTGGEIILGREREAVLDRDIETLYRQGTQGTRALKILSVDLARDFLSSRGSVGERNR